MIEDAVRKGSGKERKWLDLFRFPARFLDRFLARYLGREPVTLALLVGLAVLFFLAVTGLSRIHEMQQEALAERWAAQGVADLKAREHAAAVTDFRTALLYARDNSTYQLSLAEGLMGLNRNAEARAYLINLWEREPDNGMVSLELARIAAEQGETEQALRFYHNAIYATWTGGDQETERRYARLELIEYLLRIGSKTQAEAELIDLAASVGDESGEQALVASLFVRVGDNQRALAMFRESLKLDPHNQAAMAGAGAAAFALGLYPQAEQYLRAAVAASAADARSAELLQRSEYALTWDPFRPQIPDAQRSRIVVDAFNAAGNRLKTCTVPTAQEQDAAKAWATLQPKITIRGLRQDPDLVNSAMNLTFQIEKQTANTCGPPTETDRALSLIANLHEEH